MKYQYLKLTQIIILSLVAIYEENFIVYIGTLIISFLTHQKHWLSTFIAIALIASTLIQNIEIWKFALILFMLLIGLLSVKISRNQHLNIKYLIPVFLLSISLVSINQNQIIRISHLTIFFYFLLLTYFTQQSKLKFSLYAINFISLLQGSLFSVQHFLKLQQLKEDQSIVSQNKQWWYYLSFCFSIQCSSFIILALKGISNVSIANNQNYNIQNKKLNTIESNQPIQIEMAELPRPKSQNLTIKNEKNIDFINDNQIIPLKQRKSQISSKHNQDKQQKTVQQKLNLSKSQQFQSQSLNLILIVPFLVQNSGLLQIPLYAYMFSIHYSKNNRYFYLCMLLTNFLIILFFKQNHEWSLQAALILRISIVLLVDKNIHILNEATQIVKKIWLRSSFVLVLAFLFWYSLKTVNIIHIILTVVLLIFITTQNQKNQYSYRHKNWVYLLSFFNVFLICRELYQLLIHYNLYTEKPNFMLQNILDLIGIPHRYQTQESYFNLIPLMASIFMAFQYLTYQSKIYNQVRQRPILPIYQQKINELIKFLTIVYYKFIPWLSYVFIFFVLLTLEFSCTSLILLIWLLICLSFQVQRKNCLDTYKVMYRLWSFLQKLFAIQIILRYAFEFLNFPMFYNFFHMLPFFEIIDHYKQFLGLAIREADYVYFKTITKFQLMVGLDFACIFICFLVIQYYTFLIAYHEIENLNISQRRFRQKQIIKQIYNQFIDFKLTLYLKKFTIILKRVSKIFLWIYYPSLGIYCCFFPSILTLGLLMVCIRFYLLKNSESYDKFIKENLILKVKQLFNSWKQDSQGNSLYSSAKKIYQLMISGKKAIRFDQLISFEHLRKYVLLVSSIGIILNYSSRVFQLQQSQELLGTQNSMVLLKIRWFLYVGGTSIDSKIHLLQLIAILGSTIIEVKCSRFLLKLYDLSVQRYQGQTRQKKSDIQGKKNQVYEGQILLKSGQRSLYQSLLQRDEQNLQQLKKQLEQYEQLHDIDINPILQKNIQKLKYDKDDFEDSFQKREVSIQIRRRKQSFNITNQIRQSDLFHLKVSKKQLKKFIQMKVSLLQGITKFIQRCFVMILVFLSIVQNRHPFGIVYLVCSMTLTFVGAYSILSLSKTISVLIVLQYLLMLANYANFNVINSGIPDFKQNFQSENTFDFLFPTLSKQWEVYLTFGDTSSQILMMILSWVILFCYQLYFDVLNKSWEKILQSLAKKMALSKIQKKIYEYSNLIYTYFLIYSPLFITICSLGIYLLDFTITNLFLTFVSILFLFKSVLVEEYSGSRQFWRLYFYILQFFIVVFMLIYDVLSIPMYQKYCIKILCSSEEFHTKVYKAGLLFVLQIGIDLTKSSYFISAMDNLKLTLSRQTLFSKLAIAYKENDRKINKKFKQMNQQNSLNEHLQEVEVFLQKYKSQPDAIYQNKQQIPASLDSWKDILIDVLPTFVDSTLVLTSQQAKQFVTQQNEYWIEFCQIEQNELQYIPQKYLNQFGQIQTYLELMQKIKEIKQKIEDDKDGNFNQTKFLNKGYSQDHENLRSVSQLRKSFSENKLPYQPTEYCRQRLQQVRESLVTVNQSDAQKKNIEGEQKKKLIFLLVLQCILSNWHYLTYGLLISEHLFNMGLLTLPFPLFAFCYGLIYSYQAPKNIWRVNFILVLLPISFKFCLAIGIIGNLSQDWIHLLIGDNSGSILLEYLIIMFVLVQCLILKIIGLYDQSVTQVQSMKLALIRNIINNDNQKEISHLSELLKQSLNMPEKTVEFIFARCEQKAGYSYTTLMTSLQLTSLFFVFFFYDQMAIRKEVTIYEMISYNQFTAGMVILTLIQLGFILVERFINISDFKEFSDKWELNLVFKYIVLVINLVYTQLLILLFFPFNSNNFTQNIYIHIFYIINALVFLVSSLQIKYGIDQKSKGFMDRYTWYNGFVYMGFRAVPFLFEFKVFSDWTFTKTSLRLFDWIKLQQIFGRMYIAKCNSIFLQGKVIGSKIEWWKKVLMGVPLLFAIILLIFGPLVLFSNLNPLASKNSISAGYLELCLKVNRTNEYIFYTNSHITDIVMLTPNLSEQQILQSYDIQQDTVQVINLEEYSDQYWQISQGSYLKLLQQPSQSLYEIVIRMKFQRNQTGSTPTYTVNTYQIPDQSIQNFKNTLQGKSSMKIPNFLNNFLRLDNNNGIHFLGQQKLTLQFYAQQAKKNSNKKYWIIQNGLKIKIASDKYTKAIFGYSVMSFYISIILVIANYFRFLFQGSANTIILNDIPFADPVLSLCNGVYKARYDGNTQLQQRLFWIIIDLLRSPDQIKSLTGSYLQARIQTKVLDGQKQKLLQNQNDPNQSNEGEQKQKKQ